MKNNMIDNHLPVKHNLKLIFISSITITVLMIIVSLAGILVGDSIYPSDELLQSFLPNDVVNIVIGLPILIGSMALTRRGRLIGLLFWPGALFFVFYNYLIYVFAMPSGWAFLLHLALVVLSGYTMATLITVVDKQSVKKRLCSVVPELWHLGEPAGPSRAAAPAGGRVGPGGAQWQYRSPAPCRS